MTSEIIWGLVGWYFLPTFLANLLQKIWYGALYRSSQGRQQDPTRETRIAPTFGSPEYNRHHRRILVLVTIGYLCLNTMNMARSTTGDSFYTRLDLKFDHFTQKQLRTNFRKLSLKYHPDKVGQTGAEIFVHVREAHDVLLDPIKRQAYDRFGFVLVQSCKNCMTGKDYSQHGLTNSYQIYAGLLVALMAGSYFGQGIQGRYWLFLLLVSLFALELAMLQRSTSLAAEAMEEVTLMGQRDTVALVFELLTWLIPNRVTFERIKILRNVYTSIAFATYKMGHLISPPSVPRPKGPKAIKEMIKQLEEKTLLTSETFNEDLFELFDIYRDHSDCMIQMKRRMANMYEESKLYENPTFKEQRVSIQKRVLGNLKDEKDFKED